MTARKLLERLQKDLQQQHDINSFISTMSPPTLDVVHADHTVEIQVESEDSGHESFVWKDEVDTVHRKSPVDTLAWLYWWATGNEQGVAGDSGIGQELPGSRRSQ